MVKDENFKKLEQKIEEIRKFTNDLYEKLDEMGSGLDGIYSDLVNDLPSVEGKKLTKKQHKEMVLKMVQERCPNLVKMFNEFDLFIEGIDLLIQQRKDKFEDIDMELGEIESLQEEIEERKDRLNF